MDQSCPTLRPHGLQPARLLCQWRFSRKAYWRGLPCPLPGDLPNPGIEARSPALQTDSFQSEPPGKPKNTGVGSLFLLQGNFLTQESNRGLLHCSGFFTSWATRKVLFIYNWDHSVCVCVCVYCFVTEQVIAFSYILSNTSQMSFLIAA